MEVACRLAGIGVTDTPVSREDFTTFPPVIQRIIIAARAAIGGNVLPRTTYNPDGTLTRFLSDIVLIKSADPEGDDYVRGVCLYIRSRSPKEEVVVEAYKCEGCDTTVEKVMLAAQVALPIALHAQKKDFPFLERWKFGGLNLEVFPHFPRNQACVANKITRILERADPHYEISSYGAFARTEATLAKLELFEPVDRVERVLVTLEELPEED